MKQRILRGQNMADLLAGKHQQCGSHVVIVPSSLACASWSPSTRSKIAIEIFHFAFGSKANVRFLRAQSPEWVGCSRRALRPERPVTHLHPTYVPFHCTARPGREPSVSGHNAI